MEESSTELSREEQLASEIRMKLEQTRALASPFVLPIADFNNTQVRKFESQIKAVLELFSPELDSKGLISAKMQENQEIAKKFEHKRLIWIF
jgi:hypothetical protein